MERPKFEGFNRVIINEHGEATTLRRAVELGRAPDVGFMRDDGWTLGAPADLEEVARKQWPYSWRYKIYRGEMEWTPI